MNLAFQLERIPCRFLIAMMVFSCVCINYTMRVNLSVNLVEMVPVSNSNQTNSTSKAILNWSAYERAQVLSGFFWGYIVGAVSGGFVTAVFGPKITISIILVVSCVLTHLSPAAAKHSYQTLLIVRVILGLFSGVTFPALHILIGKWAVAVEKGRFLGALISGTIGTFFAWTICGLIIEPYGWEWGFHVFGIMGLLWVVVFWGLVYDTPEKHPRISPGELRYIQAGTDGDIAIGAKIAAPYLKILTCVPFWSLCVINFGTGWGIYFIITAAPNYLATVLGYGTSSTGVLSALIYLVRSSCSLGFGFIGDLILSKKLMSVKILRAVAAVLSHVVPGCFVLCMALPGYYPTFYVSLIVTAMGFNGCVSISAVANAHDLTNNFVGTLTGVTGMITTVAGAISPFVTAYFTKDDETNQELWRPVFYLGGVIYIVTGLQFLVFGSTERQVWDMVADDHENKKIRVVE